MTRSLKTRLKITVFIAVFVSFGTMLFITGNEYFADSAVQIHDEFTGLPNSSQDFLKPQMENLSVLGRRLFLGDESVPPHTDRNFTILVWKHGPDIEKRLMYLYGTEWHDPFKNCSVANCRIVYNDAYLQDADAVLFHLQKTPDRASLPSQHSNSNQRWVFLTDENPINTFSFSNNLMRHYNGLFNWSMTYRMDSDVPVPYGRTLPLTENDTTIERMKDKNKLVAIMISDCALKNRRLMYLKQLQKYLDIDVYGRCGTLKCAGHYGSDCPKLNDYKFYLAFENGDCKEYFSEKTWWNAYNKDSIPVILGPPIQDCARLLPPNSYLHVRNFSSPEKLAKYILHLNETPSEYESFFTWKTKYKVVNEHGYFQAPIFHYCRLCEALNYNDPSPKVYDKLENFWDMYKDCMRPVIL